MIAIIDYGAGNLRSVQKACEFLGADARITSDKSEILSADEVILPGVGAFGNCMQSLGALGLTDAVRGAAGSGKPFLGICLGLQLLFDESEESEGAAGLGIFSGKNVRLKDCGLKIPHIGWNSLEYDKNCPIFKGIGDDPFVYFVHSYRIAPTDDSIVSAYTEYGERIPVAVWRDNIFATQFHPEKSGDVGLRILQNFIELGGGA